MENEKGTVLRIIKEWMANDNELKQLQKAIKERRDKKKMLTTVLVTEMNKSNVDEYNTQCGKLIKTNQKNKKPITKGYLANCIDKIFKNNPDVQFNEFGTRRAASSVIQRKVNEVLSNQLPNQYMGTSNVAISREQDIIPKGTNAHELRMIPTALYDKPEDIIAEMYEVDRKWAKHFPELAILLPDTYGTSFYLKNCPEDIRKSHIGTRLDSKDPMEAIPEYIEWLEQHNEDPKTKIAIPSDGLNAKVAVRIVNTFK